ncbi:MAG: DNA polymerase-3 subunit delta' [Alteromonadaceae bacterium]|jgi:DNA polymerase-3 subunit delta'
MKDWLLQEKHLLSQQITSGKLPHALLINGVKGSGKYELGNWLISVLLCQTPVLQTSSTPTLACGQCKTCRLYKSNTYPDHLFIEADKATIGVDSIRNASRFFEKTAQLGLAKTVLISAAESMTIAAANALLKTLEEPTANSFIILLSSSRDTLLPTIISRCRLIEIRPPVGEALLGQLGPVRGNNYSNLSHRPELFDQNIQQQYIEFERLFITQLQGNGEKKHWLKVLDDSPDALRWLEKILTNLMRAENGWLSANNGNVDKKIEFDKNFLWQIYLKLQIMTKQVNMLSQVNRQFMIEKFIADIDHILQNSWKKGT